MGTCSEFSGSNGSLNFSNFLTSIRGANRDSKHLSWGFFLSFLSGVCCCYGMAGGTRTAKLSFFLIVFLSGLDGALSSSAAHRCFCKVSKNQTLNKTIGCSGLHWLLGYSLRHCVVKCHCVLCSEFMTGRRSLGKQCIFILLFCVQVTGSLDDCACDVETIDSFNNKQLFPKLQKLLTSDYFRFYKVSCHVVNQPIIAVMVNLAWPSELRYCSSLTLCLSNRWT